MKVNRSQSPPFLTRIVVSTLIVASFVSLFSFYDSKKGEYKQLFKTLISTSATHTLHALDPFDSMRMTAEELDTGQNSVFLATSDRSTPRFYWLKFQADYYFYPTQPTIFLYNSDEDYAYEIMNFTTPGDTVYSAEELVLDTDHFEGRQYTDYFEYERK
jgi:hypothetical protein